MRVKIQGRVSGISQDEEGRITSFVTIKPDPEKQPFYTVILPLIGVQAEMNSRVMITITDEFTQ